MRSFLRALLVAPLLFVSFAAGARSHHAAPSGGGAHRIVPSPGYSMTIPDSWGSCDADMNRQLGAPSHIDAMDIACGNNPRKPGDQLLESFEQGAPVMLFTYRETGSRFPSDFFADAPADVMAGIAKVVCAHTHFLLHDCGMHTVKLDGHTAFEGDATLSANKPFAVEFYILSLRSGTMMFFFLTPEPMRAASAGAIRDIVASIHVPADPPLAEGTATLTPLPGLTMTVPRRWTACDTANNALLANGDDPYDIKGNACEDAGDGNATGNVRVVTVDGTNIQFLNVAADQTAVDPDRFPRLLTDSALASSRDRDCGYAVESINKKTGAPPTVSDCTTSAGTIGGKPAKIVSYSATDVDDDTGLTIHAKVRVIVFPLNGHLAVVGLCATSYIEASITEATEGVLSSIVLQ